MWRMGMYIQSAVYVPLEHCLNGIFGKKGKSTYVEKPFFQEIEESSKDLTEEQKKKQTEELFLKLKVLETNYNLSKND